MKRWRCSFNIYFALACLALGGGCASMGGDNPKKQQSTIRLYIEGQKADRTTSGTVLVTRDKIPFTVERDPFLDEGDLAKASIVDDPSGDGGYSIQLTFNEHGTLLLDMYSTDHKGRHIIVFSQFPKPGKKAHEAKKKSGDSDDSDLVEPSSVSSPPAGTNTTRESAWLGAVLIRQRISNGMFRFTPDASRAEGVRIVRGLRNVIAKAKKSDKF
ncbi:MAG: hypothetical protein ABSA83_06010 [Verrucomicrobiota bacterium]